MNLGRLVLTIKYKSLLILPLTVSFAGALSAAPLELEATDILMAEATPPAAATKQDFAWSPDLGFTPLEISSGDEVAHFVGFAGADLPGEGFKWHPAFGLVPQNSEAGADPTGEPVAWTPRGTITRTVVWNDAYLQALIEKMGPLDEFALTAVADVASNGTVLGHATVGEDDSVAYFVWAEDSPLTVLQAGPDMSFVSVAALSQRGDVIGQVRQPDGSQMAAIVLPDGTVQILTGPDGAPSLAKGLNNNGEAVGTSGREPEIAVKWGADGQPVVLANSLSAPLPDGVTLTGANDINDAGQIAATATAIDGGVLLVTLTPDETTPGQYTPRVVGEIFASGAAQPDVQIALSEDGSIVGECALGARDCPTNAFDFASLDPSITNQFSPFGTTPDGFLRLVTGSSFSATQTAALGAPATATPGGGLDATNPLDRSRPGFGTPNFPTLGGLGATTAVTPTTASVPLPAAGWLLMFAVILLRGPARLLNAVRKPA